MQQHAEQIIPPLQPDWPEVLDPTQPQRRGWYEHLIIQEAIDAALFRDSKDLGITFAPWFNPISIDTIAFIVTMVSPYTPYKHDRLIPYL
jgi:hypothetical protein